MSNEEKRKLISPVRRLKPGEDIKYLLLIKLPDSDETFWEVVTGRETAYNYIKNNIDVIDVDQSYIIANKMKEVDLDNMHTIYNFVLFVKEQNDIVDEFDIDDWRFREARIAKVDSSENIGLGLESGGYVFTGLAGSYDSVDDE